MKFILSLALAVAGVSAVTTTSEAEAASTSCAADFIVTQCLSTETDKANDCKTTDYDCLCDAYQAIATCYNNCPNDSRVSDAESQVKIYCQNASLYGTRTTATTKWHASTESATATATDATAEDSTGTATSSGATSTSSDNSAADLARNTGGFLLAVAGAIAAIL